MNSIIKLLSAIIAVIAMSFCSEEFPIDDGYYEKETFEQQHELKKISKETVALSSDDASIVAQLFLKCDIETRSNTHYQTIRSIVPVNDNDNEVAFMWLILKMDMLSFQLQSIMSLY